MSQEARHPTTYATGRPSDAESLDRILEALAHPMRRVALEYLAREARAVSRDELLEHVAANVPGPDSRGGTSRESVRTQFHHVHLPRLERADLAVYDPEHELFHATPQTARAVSALEPILER